MTGPAEFVRSYLDRVVNQRDLSAVDQVAAVLRLAGRARPDWHITMQEAVELGSVAVLRASAAGTVSHDERGALLDQPYGKLPAGSGSQA